MPQSDNHSDRRRIGTQDAAIWRKSCATEAEAEAERLLDLAAFADSRINDSDDAERIAAWLASDPEAAADVAAARALALSPPAIAPEAVVSRAIALVSPSALAPAPVPVVEPAEAPSGTVVPLILSVRSDLSVFQRAARWGSLAAALVIASWLGFALGSTASLDLGATARAGDESFIGELFDPATGVLRSLTDGLET